MVVLSACQTAFTDFRHLPDEVVGLLAGFLQAGVPSVIGSLWSVNDRSTALLMTRFYELYLHGDTVAGIPPQSPARALRLAQCWLRNLTWKDLQSDSKDQPSRHLHLLERDSTGPGKERPYADPYCWAAFVYYGVVFKP
jgi:CHAT domain-containing protein